MRKFTALLLAALVLVGANIALADKTITLDKDTKLVPQGWTVADDIKFKKNTVVKLNDDGQVIEGVLASATYLRPAGWKSLASNYYYVERSAPFFPPRRVLPKRPFSTCSWAERISPRAQPMSFPTPRISTLSKTTAVRKLQVSGGQTTE